MTSTPTKTEDAVERIRAGLDRAKRERSAGLGFPMTDLEGLLQALSTAQQSEARVREALDFDAWLETFQEDVVQGEYGYEPGEFTVYPEHWRQAWEDGLTPSAAFRRACEATTEARKAEDALRAADALRIKAEDRATVAEAKLAALAPPPEEAEGGTPEGPTPEQAWRDLLEKDDRTSPEDCPDMALITFDELSDYMRSASPGPSRVEPVGWAAVAHPELNMGVIVEGVQSIAISKGDALYGKGRYDLRPLGFTSPPSAQARVEELEALGAWAFLDKCDLSLERSYGEDPSDEPAWVVHRITSGGVNDVEWAEIGRGETPLAAVLAARAALGKSGERG